MTETPDAKELKARILGIMNRHVGPSRKISMAELQEAIYGERVRHSINDTRKVRNLVDELVCEGRPIVSDCSRRGGGYYMAEAGNDLDTYCEKLKATALKKLKKVSRLKKLTLPGLLGQMQMDLIVDNVKTKKEKHHAE